MCSLLKEGVFNIEKKEIRKIRSKYHLDNLRSHSDFISLLAQCNSYVEIKEPFKGFGKETLFYCSRCRGEFTAFPETVLRVNNGCPNCKKRRTPATNEQFLEKMKAHPTIVPLEPYIKSSVGIFFRCCKCGYIWKTTPSSILKGTGCMACHRKNTRYTQEDFEVKLLEINPNIKILGKYQRSDQPIEAECMICGNIWHPMPHTLLEGHGCPDCANQNRRNSVEDLLEELRANGVDITLKGDYTNLGIPVEVVCNKCGYIWKPFLGNLLRGGHCPNCWVIAQTKTHQQYIQELETKNIPVVPLETYQNARTSILHRCLVCGHEWKAYPDNILKGHGCPRCGNKTTTSYTRITPDEYVQRLAEVHGDTIIALEPYKSSFIPIKFLCNKCGCQWSAQPHSVLCGKGCPKCASSHGEKAISLYLQNHNIPYESQKTFPDLKGVGGRALRYDFYLPIFNIVIEFNGKQHYQNVAHFGGERGWAIRQEHDYRKTQHATDHGIGLIVIRYDEDISEVLDQYFNIFFNNLKLESRETVTAV